jgi:O-antigen ligase
MGRSDDVSALTGRIPLWQFIWDDAAGRRLQGFGYGAYWIKDRTLAAHDALEWFPHHSHSAYIETIVNIGLIGLTLVLAIGLFGLQRAAWLAARTRRPEYCALFAIVVAAFVNGVTETAFAMPRDMGLFVGAAVLSLAVVHRGRQGASAANTKPDTRWVKASFRMDQPGWSTQRAPVSPK